jgi:hypothetical protein
MIFMQIDEPGPDGKPVPHWLLDKGRAWLRWFLRQQRDRKESAAFYAKHGPVVRTEPNNRKEG